MTDRELLAEARKHLENAIWSELASIAFYNIGPATHEAVEWFGARRGLKRLLDAYERALRENERFRSLTLHEVEDENDRLRCLQFQEAATTLALSASNRAKDAEIARLQSECERLENVGKALAASHAALREELDTLREQCDSHA